MATKDGAIEIALNNGYVFTNALSDDMLIRTTTSNQCIHLGTYSNDLSALKITSNSVWASSNMFVANYLSVGTSNTFSRINVDGGINMTGNIYKNSNLFITDSNTVMGLFKVGMPIRRLFQPNQSTSNFNIQIDGDFFAQVTDADVFMNGTKLAYIDQSNNDYTLDVERNGFSTLFKVVLGENVASGDVVDISIWPSMSNFFAQNTFITACNLTASLASIQNFNTSNMFITNSISIGDSNITAALKVSSGDALFSSNAYVIGALGVGVSNPITGREMDVWGPSRNRLTIVTPRQISLHSPGINQEIWKAYDYNVLFTKYSTTNFMYFQYDNKLFRLQFNATETSQLRNTSTWISTDYGLNWVAATSLDILSNSSTFTSGAIYIQELEDPSFPSSITNKFGYEIFTVNSNGRIGINNSNPLVSLHINSTDAILLPKGTTAERPGTPQQGYVRYNTSINTFEGYGAGNAWGSLGGVKDTNQDTYISAESFPTSNDDNLVFFNSNQEKMRLTKAGYLGIGSSNPQVSLEINATDAILLPKGNTSQRPGTPQQGLIRYNTQLSTFEGYGSGNAWGSLGGVKDTNQDTYISAETFPTSNDDSLVFFNSNIERMRLTKTGLLGIGISNPTYTLEVNGNAKIYSNVEIVGNLTVTGTTQTIDSTTVTIADNVIRLNNGAAFSSSLQSGIEINRGTGNSNYNIVYDEITDSLRTGFTGVLSAVATRDDNPSSFSIPYYDTSTSNYAATNQFVYSNNNLGVGVTNPIYKFDTNGAMRTTNSNAPGIILEAAGHTNISFSNNRSASTEIGLAYNNGNYSSHALSNDLIIRNNATTGKIMLQNGVSTSALLVNSNNFVGINTSTPLTNLHVVSGSTILDASTLSDNRLILAKNVASNINSIVFTQGGNTTAQGFAELGLTGDNNLSFKVNSVAGTYVTRMLINQSGFVGIGSNPDKQLVVGTSSSAQAQIKINSTDGDKLYLTPFDNGSRIGHGTGWNFDLYAGQSNLGTNSGIFRFFSGTSSSSSYAERMRITELGNVGIANTNPSCPLVVQSATNTGCIKLVNNTGNAGDQWWLGFGHGGTSTDANDRARVGVNIIAGGAGRLYFTTGTAGSQTERMRIDESGNVGINTSNISYRLHVIGDIFASSDIIAYSDSNVKTDLERITNAVEKLEKINGYTYRRKDLPEDSKRYAGLIAQEVQGILPEVVHKDEEGKLSIAYGNMASILVEAIKELKSDVEKIKKHLNI